MLASCFQEAAGLVLFAPLSFILTRLFEISLALNFRIDFGVQVRRFHVIRAHDFHLGSYLATNWRWERELIIFKKS